MATVRLFALTSMVLASLSLGACYSSLPKTQKDLKQNADRYFKNKDIYTARNASAQIFYKTTYTPMENNPDKDISRETLEMIKGRERESTFNEVLIDSNEGYNPLLNIGDGWKFMTGDNFIGFVKKF